MKRAPNNNINFDATGALGLGGWAWDDSLEAAETLSGARRRRRHRGTLFNPVIPEKNTGFPRSSPRHKYLSEATPPHVQGPPPPPADHQTVQRKEDLKRTLARADTLARLNSFHHQVKEYVDSLDKEDADHDDEDGMREPCDEDDDDDDLVPRRRRSLSAVSVSSVCSCASSLAAPSSSGPTTRSSSSSLASAFSSSAPSVDDEDAAEFEDLGPECHHTSPSYPLSAEERQRARAKLSKALAAGRPASLGRGKRRRPSVLGGVAAPAPTAASAGSVASLAPHLPAPVSVPKCPWEEADWGEESEEGDGDGRGVTADVGGMRAGSRIQERKDLRELRRRASLKNLGMIATASGWDIKLRELVMREGDIPVPPPAEKEPRPARSLKRRNSTFSLSPSSPISSHCPPSLPLPMPPCTSPPLSFPSPRPPPSHPGTRNPSPPRSGRAKSLTLPVRLTSEPISIVADELTEMPPSGIRRRPPRPAPPSTALHRRSLATILQVFDQGMQGVIVEATMDRRNDSAGDSLLATGGRRPRGPLRRVQSCGAGLTQSGNSGMAPQPQHQPQAPASSRPRPRPITSKDDLHVPEPIIMRSPPKQRR
ncbi:hypothetical protein BDK51DRAFT_40695 [Blyttiomyces helicus]|uniref:Uncharacterized protein n=1 Tax=Blyttiomyces helicus TaxID=388810 RepID=A0A4P9WDG2_9FUNG|nr:hypothetical protein BDK51DRAFT_40695 [Blyttiomyces helicus]|eukprot:RKO89703.1 hypothetical protein BDK51DRAFT_40695 [Blyttiomyces helicus]